MTTCKFCNYQWKARVKSPKKCPMCQRWIGKRFDTKAWNTYKLKETDNVKA